MTNDPRLELPGPDEIVLVDNQDWGTASHPEAGQAVCVIFRSNLQGFSTMPLILTHEQCLEMRRQLTIKMKEAFEN